MKYICRVVMAFAGLTVSNQAFAQSSDAESTSGSATIVRAVSMEKTSDLAFGRIVRPSSGSSTVEIDADTGVRSIDGNGVLLSGSFSRAAYSVEGEGGQTVSLSLSPLVLAGPEDSDPITVTLAKSDDTAVLSGSLGGDGSASFQVGGSFAVSSTTATGAYRGTFTATVAYL